MVDPVRLRDLISHIKGMFPQLPAPIRAFPGVPFSTDGMLLKGVMVVIFSLC